MGRIVSLAMFCGVFVSALPSGQPAAPQRVNPAMPPVAIPSDNPQTDAKVALGRQLFFDPRLSADNTISCATCHDEPDAGLFITTLELTDADKRDLVAFMESLTGTMPAIERPALPGRPRLCHPAERPEVSGALDNFKST